MAMSIKKTIDEADVDFIICWVDGTDPDWCAEKKRYTPPLGDDDRDVRYRNWDNLQYWFRGIEQYTPWVRRVHLVTWGHLPKWLNTRCPKLHIVNHADYIPKAYLPTYSSHTIENNLHRIRGLAEKFVYFNDDMFIIRPMPQTDFFQHSLPTDFAIAGSITTSTKEDVMPFIKLEMASIMNSSFDKHEQIKHHADKWITLVYGADVLRNIIMIGQHHFRGFANNHLPFSYMKKTFGEVWQMHHDVLDQTCQHKYRNKLDVNQWLFRYWQLAKGEFQPIPRRYKGKVYEVFGGVDDNQRLFDIVEQQRYRMVCINDNEQIDFEGIKARLNQAFSSILPTKSSFEL